jgi:hypothetical protein
MGVTAVKKSPPLEVWLLAALKRYPDQIGRVRAALPDWTAEARIGTILDAFVSGGPPTLSGDVEVESLYAAIEQYDEPDGGIAVIDDLMWRLQRDAARRRYDEIKEMLRQGVVTPDLMEEVRQLGARLERYQDRKEG